MMGRIPELLSLVLLVASCTSSGARDQDSILLENLSFFDVESGEMRGPLDLLVEGGRIREIGSDAGAALRIDCSGKYAVPGLCDCHTHLVMLTMEGEEHAAAQLRAFVEGGVTHVRDVGGPVELLQEWSGRIAAGELVGPEIFYCGPMLERSPLTWGEHNEELPGFTVAVDTKESVDRLLPELAAKGACLLKTFSKQDAEVYEHLVKRADELSLRIVHDPGGPLFHAVPMDRAMELGVTSFEHAKAPWPVVLKDELREEHDALLARDAGRTEIMPFAMKVFGLGVESVSVERLDRLCETMREKGAYLCPTLRVFDSRREEGPAEDVPEQAREMQERVMAAMEEVSRFFVAELSKRGVKLLVGHDGPWPDGIFDDMERMSECGVSEVEILRGATLYPAQWLGVEERLGSISPGKEANLLVLDGNPLEDIGQIRSTFLVLQRGDIVFRKEGER
jgi:imidazolonepropionase-like amidohydrolase